MVTESKPSIRLVSIALLVAMLALAFAASVSRAEAHGLSKEQLEDAGFTCQDIAGAWHCAKTWPEGQASVQVKVFSYDGAFQGTEILLRSDLYAGQPCPQEELSEYVDIGGYHACHHYEH